MNGPSGHATIRKALTKFTLPKKGQAVADAKITQQDLFPQADPLVTAYEAGESQQKIADRLGVSQATVSNRLRKAGAKMRTNRKDDIKPGSEFGQLTAREPRGEDWLCVCSCGREELANSSALRFGRHVRCAECRKGPAEAPETHACRVCGEAKAFTLDNFAPCELGRYGLRRTCRVCTREDGRTDGLRCRRALRLEVLTHYSGGVAPFCVCCGTAALEWLALDHLEGSSREDYARFRSTSKFFYHLRKTGYQLRAQVRCHNCNAAIAHHGVCPHRPEITRPVKAGEKQKRPMPATPLDFVGAKQRCIHCRLELPLTADFFHRNKPMPTGFTTVCRACDNARRKADDGPRREQTRLEVLRHYSNGAMRCACCGTDHPEFLTIDHVDNDGKEHRESVKGPLYRALKKQGFPSDYRLRVLCFCCNQSRGYYGYCPCENS